MPALAVGHGRRNAVGNQANAAHAERRARAKASRRDLQVLRVVLAVLDDNARDAPEALGEIDLRPAFADLVGVEAVDRCGNIQARLRHARRRDHDRVLLLLRKAAARQQKPSPAFSSFAC